MKWLANVAHGKGKVMIDTLLNWLFFVALVAALVSINVYALRYIAGIWWQKGPAIMPFKVVGGDQALGPAMATLLQARLAELQRQLEQVKGQLTQAEPELASCPAEPEKTGSQEHEGGKPAPPVPTIKLVSVPLSTSVFQQTNLSLTVGGVDVGGMLGWIQRMVTSSRELQFTVSFSNGEAVVAGDLASLPGGGSVWLETKQVTPPQIADMLAHRLIAEHAKDDNFAALGAEKFQKLTRALSIVADLNQRAAAGASVRKELSAEIPGLMDIAQAAPHWPDLLYFIANVAENAGDNSRALILYQRVRSELSRQAANKRQRASVSRETVEAKLKDLRFAPPTGFFDDLAPRLLSATGLFEFGRMEPARMYAHVGLQARDRDIEFGVASWSLSRGRLVPLLRKMRATDPQRFYEIVGSGAEQIDALLDCTTKPAEFIAQAVREHHLDPGWQSRFERLGSEPEFQKLQVTTLEPFFRRAIELADHWGLKSEQGLAQMFDLVFFRGGMPRNAYDAIETKIQAVRDEPDRMKMIAETLAESLPAKFTRTRILYFADPTNLEKLGLGQKSFRGT